MECCARVNEGFHGLVPAGEGGLFHGSVRFSVIEPYNRFFAKWVIEIEAIIMANRIEPTELVGSIQLNQFT